MRRNAKISRLLVVPVAMTVATCVFLSFRAGALLSPCPRSATASPGRSPEQESRVATSRTPVRRVTKSLAELGQMDERNAHVVFFNAVPKCGSELLVLLMRWLQGWNNFRHVRLKGGTTRKLSRLGQEKLVYELYETAKNEAVPLSFDRHVYFVNFTSFDRQSPTFINLIRNPMDMVMHRFSSEHARKYVPITVKKMQNKYVMRAFRTCLIEKQDGCYFRNGMSYDLAIPYFCGQHERCRMLNDPWALQAAKNNVERYYPVVGILEELNSTLEVLESNIPYFFKGVQKLYYKDLLEPHHARYKKPLTISQDIKGYLQAILRTELEFYEWLKSRLFVQLQVIYGNHSH